MVNKITMAIEDLTWNLVSKWDGFEDTLGKQMVRAADSMALNGAEGYG